MRKLLLSVLLCAALVMGLLPTAAFPMELGNTPESVEEAPTSAWEEQTVNEELLSEYGEQKNAPKAANPAAQNDACLSLIHIFLVEVQHLGDLLLNGIERVQGGHRILEHHGDCLASDLHHFPLALFADVLALEKNPVRFRCV